jgi:alpha-L-rhamnosidase
MSEGEEKAYKAMEKLDWQAKWAVSPFTAKPSKQGSPATYFKKTFRISSDVRSARIYATCHGVYQLSVNGVRADDREFAPEFTVYEKYLCYQVYDISTLLNSGENTLEITVSDGWYRGFTTKQTKKGEDDRHAVLFQLEVTYADETSETICSDSDMLAAHGQITRSDLFNGEDHDANAEPNEWQKCQIADFGNKNLVLQTGEPVRPVLTLHVKQVIKTPKGETVLDFGQNIAGRLRSKINLPKGAVVIFEHSETLDKNGNYFNNIQGVKY